MPKAIVSALVLLLVTSLVHPAFAGEEEKKGRKVFENYKHAVVTVQLVAKIRFGQNDDEMKMEATGTVISPDGLVVVALSSVDPTALLRNMGAPPEYDSEISLMNLLLADETELPAKIVLRDNELDLAYIRPIEKPKTALPFVNFEDSDTVDVLDRLITINRLGKVANRVYSVSFERVDAVVAKPRTFYIPGKDPTSTAQGSPAFTLDGKIVGLFVVRTIKDTGGGRRGENIAGIILPAEDILEGATQAPGYESE
jgi:S1-C subfamily serine protease